MKRHVVLFSATLFTLVACGGGGGGDNPGGGSNGAPQPSVQITSGNAAQVAATSMSDDTVMSNTGGVTFFSAEQPQQNALKLTELTRKILRLDQRGTLQAQIFENFCESGSVSEPPPGSTSGTITFTNCVSSGFTFNGSVSFSFVGDQNNFTVTVSYVNFIVTYAGEVATINASLSIMYNDNGVTETATISIPEFRVELGGEYVRMVGYTATEITDNNFNTTTSLNYTFDSTLIGGVVRVTTDPGQGGQAIQQDFMDPFPHTGRVVIIGQNSRVRVSANGDGSASGMVTIEVDANGDGVYEDMISMTWSQFSLLNSL